MATKPKKYIINPEYLSDEAVRERFRGTLDYEEDVCFFPEEHGLRIPPEGCWIRVLLPPATSIQLEPHSMYYALPTERLRGSSGYSVHLARVLTPEGELMLWPYEYGIVEDIREWVGMEGVHIHYLDPAAEISPDKLFYIRSRGISKAEAMLMLIGEMRTQTFCYFTLEIGYQIIFAGAGVQAPHARDTVLRIIERQEKAREQKAMTLSQKLEQGLQNGNVEEIDHV